MKKVLLTLAAMALTAASASAAANVYASALKAENGKISCVLNDAAEKVVLNIVKDGQIVKSVELGAGVKGVNTFDMPSVDIDPGTYNWSLTASAAAIAELTQFASGATEALQVSAGRGIAVDASPESPCFGNLYTVSPETTTRQGARIECGMYVFNAALEPLNETAYTGGIAWAGQSGPNNVAVASNGQVFVCDWTDGGNGGVYYFEPGAPESNWKNVFATGETDGNGLVTVNGVKVHGSVQDIALFGNGADRKLYTDDEDINGGNGDIFIYNIGELATPWDAAPSATWGGNTTGMTANGNHRLQPDGRGGLWTSQYRWAEAEAFPCLFHINAAGEWDFKTGDKSIIEGNGPVGAFAVNTAGNLMAIADGSNKGNITLAKVTFGENGVPALEVAATIKVENMGVRPFDVAFDAADNFYVIYNNDNAEGGIAAWACPKAANEFTTPANGTISVESSGVANAVVATPISFAGGIITAAEGAEVFNALGVKVAEGTEISTENLAGGVYIVRAGKASLKIVK